MFRLSISIVVFVATITSTVVRAEISFSPAKANATTHKILMFGASWCAPCVAELRNIVKLASDASPDQIVIAWADGSIRRYKLPALGNVRIASGEGAQELVRRYASGAPGLPYSVMIDGQGRRCGEWKSGLNSDAIVRMRTACAAGSSLER